MDNNLALVFIVCTICISITVGVVCVELNKNNITDNYTNFQLCLKECNRISSHQYKEHCVEPCTNAIQKINNNQTGVIKNEI